MAVPSFNYNVPTGIYPPSVETGAQDMLNALSRAIPGFVVGQNVGKLSPLMRKLLSIAEVKAMSFPFISQPVTGTTISHSQYVQYDGAFNVPTSLDVDLTKMATFYANMILDTLYITDVEAKAFEAGNPYMLYNNLKVRASLVWIGLMNTITQNLTGTRVSGGSEDTTKFYGMKDIIDDGSTNANFGNIARGTYTWWNSKIYNAASLWTDSPPAFVYVMRALSKFQNEVSTMGMPTCGFTSQAVWQKLAESFTNIERYIVADTGKLEETREYEVTGIVIQGIPIFPDPYLTDNIIYFINFDHLKFDFVDGYVSVVTPWYNMTIVGKLAYLALIIIGGQLWSDAPVSCFQLTNMPAVANI
jgi:hypothetical protein